MTTPTASSPKRRYALTSHLIDVGVVHHTNLHDDPVAAAIELLDGVTPGFQTVTVDATAGDGSPDFTPYWADALMRDAHRALGRTTAGEPLPGDVPADGRYRQLIDAQADCLHRMLLPDQEDYHAERIDRIEEWDRIGLRWAIEFGTVPPVEAVQRAAERFRSPHPQGPARLLEAASAAAAVLRYRTEPLPADPEERHRVLAEGWPAYRNALLGTSYGSVQADATDRWWTDHLAASDPVIAPLVAADSATEEQAANARHQARFVVSWNHDSGDRADLYRDRMQDPREFAFGPDLTADPPTPPAPEPIPGLDGPELDRWPRRLGLHEAAELWRSRAPHSRYFEVIDRGLLTSRRIHAAELHLRPPVQQGRLKEVSNGRVQVAEMDARHAVLGLLLDVAELTAEVEAARDRLGLAGMIEAARVEKEQRAQGAHPVAAARAADQAHLEVVQPGLQALEARLQEQRRLARAGIALVFPEQMRTQGQYRQALRRLVNADFYADALPWAQEQWQAKVTGLADMEARYRDPSTVGWGQAPPTQRDIDSMKETVAHTRTSLDNLRTEMPRARAAERAITAVVAEPLDQSPYMLDTTQVRADHARTLAHASGPYLNRPVQDMEGRLAALRQQSRQRLQSAPSTSTSIAPISPAARPRPGSEESQHQHQQRPPLSGRSH